MKLQRIDVYATPIWTFDLVDMEPHVETMIQTVRQLRAEANDDIKQKSNRNGWHSRTDILKKPEFQPLRSALRTATREVFDDYGIDPKDRLIKLSGWANIHDQGGYNTNHLHPGAWLSGTFYLLTPQGAGRLFFYDPRPAPRMEQLPMKKSRSKDPLRARSRFTVNPRPCCLVMFPSWFEHSVESAECDERISIAFNVSPVAARRAAPKSAAETGNTAPDVA